MLSPPYTPPAQQQQLLPMKKVSHEIDIQTFPAQFIQQVSKVLDQPVLDLQIITRGDLFHVLCIQVSKHQSVLLRTFTHHTNPSEAFFALMESLMQDAEEFLLTIPYDLIRQYCDTADHLSLFHNRQSSPGTRKLILIGHPTPFATTTTKSSSPASSPKIPPSAIWQTHPSLLWADEDLSDALSPSSIRRPPPGPRLLRQLLCICAKALYVIVSSYNRNYHGGDNRGTTVDRDDREITARRQLTAALAQLTAHKDRFVEFMGVS